AQHHHSACWACRAASDGSSPQGEGARPAHEIEQLRLGAALASVIGCPLPASARLHPTLLSVHGWPGTRFARERSIGRRGRCELLALYRIGFQPTPSTGAAAVGLLRANADHSGISEPCTN